MSRWLRDVEVFLKQASPLVPAPGRGGFVRCNCFLETYRHITGKLLRTNNTGKIVVELDSTMAAPVASPAYRGAPTEVATVQWPIDMGRLKSVTAEEWIRIHFEEMHAACLYLARERGWPTEPFEAAREAVFQSNYRYLGQAKKKFTSPDRRHRMGLFFDMDLEWFVVFAVLFKRDDAEVGRREIARYPACGEPDWKFLRGSSKWLSNTTFQFVSSDNWFEPRSATVTLQDFARSGSPK